jgi:hypothetical protein
MEWVLKTPAGEVRTVGKHGPQDGRLRCSAETMVRAG